VGEAVSKDNDVMFRIPVSKSGIMRALLVVLLGECVFVGADLVYVEALTTGWALVLTALLIVVVIIQGVKVDEGEVPTWF